MEVNFAEFNLSCTGFGGHGAAAQAAMNLDSQPQGRFTANAQARSGKSNGGRGAGL